MLIIGRMFEFSLFFLIWISDLNLRPMDFGFEFVLDLGFFKLDPRFAKIDVGYFP